MKNYIMNLITNNIITIIIGAVVIVVIGIIAYNKMKNLTMCQKKAVLLKALLEMVIIAEGKLGEGVGKDKKDMVYTMFKSKFPILSIIITQSVFDALLNEALDDMKKILEKEILELDPEGNVTNLTKLLNIDVSDTKKTEINTSVKSSVNNVNSVSVEKIQ